MHHAGDDARARRSLRTEVHLKRAVLHSRASRYDKAIGDYNEALKGEGGSNAHAWLWRGVAFHAHGYHKSAQLDYSRCLELDGHNYSAR